MFRTEHFFGTQGAAMSAWFQPPGVLRLDKAGGRLDNDRVARVVLQHLTKAFRGPRGERILAVQDLELTVEAGELLTLVGPSACGKTTLLRLIAGLEMTDAGSVSIGGRAMDGVPASQREVAMVFQSLALYPHLTVRGNLALGLRLRAIPPAEAQARIADTARRLGLADCLERRPAELSGGQRQRVALARALVRRPAVLLLDEPFSNLDAPLRLRLRDDLARLHAALGLTILHVTHDQDEAAALGQRMALMHSGALQQVGKPATLYAQPANTRVAAFLGAPPMNFLRGTLSAGGASFVLAPPLGGAALTLPAAQAQVLWSGAARELDLGLRPEHVLVGSLAGSNLGLASASSLCGTVQRVALAVGRPWLRVVVNGRPIDGTWQAARSPVLDEPVPVQLDLRHACFFEPLTGQRVA
jgi:multiple sugar transport system ATP-binding protein